MHGWRKRWFRLLRAMGVNYFAAKHFLFHLSLHWASRYQMDGCNYKSGLKAASIVFYAIITSSLLRCLVMQTSSQQPKTCQITEHRYEEYRNLVPLPFAIRHSIFQRPGYQPCGYNALNANIYSLDAFPCSSISAPVTSTVIAAVVFKRSLYALGSARNASSPEKYLRKSM